MQFVRTVTGFRQHTIRRKLYEAVLAIIVRSRYGKLAILRSYTACAFFGSGLVGADAAARKLFGKDATRLMLNEAAVIAAMLARPRPLHGPANWEAKVRRRAAYGLELHRLSQQDNSVPLFDPERVPERAKAKSRVARLTKSWT
jgi:membrane peptidoglycan carboxypeptidase